MKYLQTYPVRSIVVGVCHRDIPGGVCTFYIRTCARIIIENVRLRNMTYIHSKTSTVRSSLIQLTQDIQKYVNVGRFVRVPDSLQYAVNARYDYVYTVTDLLADIHLVSTVMDHAVVLCTQRASFDTYTYSHMVTHLTAGLDSDDEEKPLTVMLLDYQHHNGHGHLFRITTERYGTHQVCFSPKGVWYSYTYDMQQRFHYPNLMDLMMSLGKSPHADIISNGVLNKKEKVVKFIKRKPHSLAQLCRQVLLRHSIPTVTLPLLLRAFVQEHYHVWDFQSDYYL